MIYISPHIDIESSFYKWFLYYFPSCKYETPSKLNDDDLLIRYSPLGFLPIEGKQLSLYTDSIYEDYNTLFYNAYINDINSINQSLKYSTFRMFTKKEYYNKYKHYGTAEILDIPINKNIYKKMNASELRQKYNINTNLKVGIWMGNTSPIKGFDLFLKCFNDNNDIFWIIILDTHHDNIAFTNNENILVHNTITGEIMPELFDSEKITAELLNCADFFLSTNRTNNYFYSELKAVSCDIPIIKFNIDKYDFEHIDISLLKDYETDEIDIKNKWEELFLKWGIKW